MRYNTGSEGPFFGPYLGTVVQTQDPERNGRITLRCAQVYGVDDGASPESPWALPRMGGGGMGDGMLWVPKPGDTVWVEFIGGDPDYPVWSPGPYRRTGGFEHSPQHTRGRYDQSDMALRGTDEIPPTQFAAPRADQLKGITTAAGRLEFQEVEGATRVLLEHKSGSRIEILEDGSVYIVSKGNRVEVTGGSERTRTVGSSTDTREGAVAETFKRGETRTHEGEVEEIFVRGVRYTYKSSVEERFRKRVIIVDGTQNSRVGGASVSTVMGSDGETIFGSYSRTLLDTAQWLVANKNLSMMALRMGNINPAIGAVELFNGTDPTGLLNNRLLLRHPIGGIPGAAGVVLSAVAMLALQAPVVTIGGLEGIVGKEPAARGGTLYAWLLAHAHPPSGGPPIVPPPLSMISPSVYL